MRIHFLPKKDYQRKDDKESYFYFQMHLELQTRFEGVYVWLLLYITTQYNSYCTPAVRLLMVPFEQLRVESHSLLYAVIPKQQFAYLPFPTVPLRKDSFSVHFATCAKTKPCKMFISFILTVMLVLLVPIQRSVVPGGKAVLFKVQS